jgi:ribA/ribD-fused uncharacterized protein
MMPSTSITSFSGAYTFLSNFYASPVLLRCLDIFDEDSYPTVEHAFQAAKSREPAVREDVRTSYTPGRAKRLGRVLSLRSDWDTIKFEVMESLLRQKFAPHRLGGALLRTGDVELVEGNTWHDRIWGVCICERCRSTGQNELGKLLMKIRKDMHT